MSWKGYFCRLERFENGGTALESYRHLLETGNGVVTDKRGNIKANVIEKSGERKVVVYVPVKDLSRLLVSGEDVVFYRKTCEESFEMPTVEGNGNDKKREFADKNFFSKHDQALMVVENYTRENDNLALISTGSGFAEEKFRVDVKLDRPA